MSINYKNREEELKEGLRVAMACILSDFRQNHEVVFYDEKKALKRYKKEFGFTNLGQATAHHIDKKNAALENWEAISITLNDLYWEIINGFDEDEKAGIEAINEILIKRDNERFEEEKKRNVDNG
tara:strand:+ start:140 stop:514 length:375 start_codon:yes stop_codon:yes gene_type:complete